MNRANPIGRDAWQQAWRQAPKDGITPATVAVGFALATYADTEGGSVRPSQGALARAVGVRRESAGRAVATLRRLGWVELVSAPQGRRPGVYRLTLPPA